jgi:hypothetical protein
MVIIGAGFVAIITAFQGSSKNSLLTDQTLVASNLAAETMDKIFAQRDCNNAGCKYASTLASINTSNTYDYNPAIGFAGYVIDSTALEVNPDADAGTDDFLDASAGSGYARVTVTVTWNNGANSISLVSLMANY